MYHLDSSKPLLRKVSGDYIKGQSSLIYVSVAMAAAVVCMGMAYLHQTSNFVSLQGSATIPMPLEPGRLSAYSNGQASRSNRVKESQIGELAVATLTRLIMKSAFVNTGGRFHVSKGAQLSQQNSIVTIGGKRYLRTTLLDAIWDYHESPEAKALVNEAIEEQSIEAATQGTEIPPETMAANALERLQAGDLDFESKWATGGEMHVAAAAVNISKWEAQVAMDTRDAAGLQQQYEDTLTNLSEARTTLTTLQEKQAEAVQAVSAAEANLSPLEKAVQDATAANEASQTQLQTATAAEAAAQAAVDAAAAAYAAVQSDENATGLDVVQAYSANEEAAQELMAKQAQLAEAKIAADAAAAVLQSAQTTLSEGETALESVEQAEAAAAAAVTSEQAQIQTLESEIEPRRIAAETAAGRSTGQDTIRQRAVSAAEGAAGRLGWSPAMGVPPSLEPDGSVPPRTWARLWS